MKDLSSEFRNSLDSIKNMYKEYESKNPSDDFKFSTPFLRMSSMKEFKFKEMFNKPNASFVDVMAHMTDTNT